MVSRNLLATLKIKMPVIQAPMLGWATPAMAAAVSNAGALGAIGIGGMNAEDARAVIRATRALTDKPFNVNLFCHRRAISDPSREARWLEYLEPHFAHFQSRPPTTLRDTLSTFSDDDAVLTMLLDERPAVVSFHFGLPEPTAIAALRDAGIVLFATATNRQDAERIADAHIDAIVAQGAEAGGHRGTFDPAAADEMLGTATLVRLFARENALPIIAAGGIMDGAGIAAMLALGAQAAQLGTAFVVTDESAASAADRAALLDRESRTAFTKAVSGRLARGIESPFTRLGQDPACPPIPDFPIAFEAARALAGAAKAHGSSDYDVRWAGAAVRLARAMPAAELVAVLMQETVDAVGSDDCVNGEGSFPGVPGPENNAEQYCEYGRARVKADSETIGQHVSQLRADHADQHDGEPVDPRYIGSFAELRSERGSQHGKRDCYRQRGAEADMDSKVVGTRLADRGGQDLDCPEGDCDLRNLVLHRCNVSM
jgi:nitronate monooxygenase